MKKEKRCPCEDFVKCQTCRCYLNECDAQKVEVGTMIGSITLHYCQAHRSPFDKMSSGKYYKNNVEVTSKGVIKREKK